MSFVMVSPSAWLTSIQDLDYKVEDIQNNFSDLYPKRATKFSAGYDFFMPFDLTVEPDKNYIVPTGFKWNSVDSYIKAKVDFPVEDDKNKKTVESDNPFDNTIFVQTVHLRIDYSVLLLLPRSSLAFNYGFRLLNTVGVIDSDYYNNKKNEGHIMVAFKVDKELTLKRGDKFCQGIIMPFAFNSNDGEDVVSTTRKGGMGSTDN